MSPRRFRSLTILRNTLSNYARQVVMIGSMLVLTPLMASRLGADGFGLWSLVWATVGLLGLLDAGLSHAVVRYIAEARGAGDEDRLDGLSATFFWTYLALAGVFIAASVVLAPFFAEIFSLPSALRSAGTLCFVLIAIRSAQIMPLGMFMGVLGAHQKIWWSNLLKIAGTLCFTAAAMAVLLPESGDVAVRLVQLSWMSLLSNVATNLGAMALALGHLPGTSLAFRGFRWELLREILSFSGFSFVIQISTLIYTRADTLIIQGTLTLTAVAVYTVAIRISEKAGSFCEQLTRALTPMVAELEGAGDSGAVRAVFIKGSKLATALALPLLVGAFVLCEDLVRTWMGSAYLDAVLPCRILLAATLIGVIHGLASTTLYMTGRHRYVAMVRVAGQICNLVLTLIFVRRWGVGGVALATLVSSFIVEVGFVQRKANRHVGMTAREFYGRVLLPQVLPTLLMVAVVLSVRSLVGARTLLHVAAFEGLAVGTFGVAFLFLGLRGEERTYYLDRLRRLVARRAPVAACENPPQHAMPVVGVQSA